MPNSAGLLMYRVRDGHVEVLLVHPGGPFFAKKDDGVWTIPKGLPDEGEELLDCAMREFKEETGFDLPDAARQMLLPLGTVRQKGGKTVHAWAFAGDCDPSKLVSNAFELEWPPRSGKRESFAEVDRAAFFTLDDARQKINPAQAGLLTRLAERLAK